MQEVKVPNTSYFKLVAEDGSVAVVLAGDYGGGWSSSESDSSVKTQMMFDSRIVRYVLSGENKNISQEDYNDLMKTIFPDLGYYRGDCDGFFSLTVKFIPKDTLFRIQEYDGIESIVLFDPKNYFTA
jgi:hypothetical protein